MGEPRLRAGRKKTAERGQSHILEPTEVTSVDVRDNLDGLDEPEFRDVLDELLQAHQSELAKEALEGFASNR